MENVIINFFKENKLKLNNKSVVVATSTGVDSMVLLNLFLKLKKQYVLNVICAHVNHLKRTQSMEEEKYIVSFCEKNNIKYYIKRLNDIDDDENFQSEARNERYLFFDEIIKIENAEYLALAHHANDNMETIMMRILRGSNLLGYSGINPIIKRNNYLVIRPLLEILKETIVNYADKEEITYFEDETNYEDYYTRNKIRHEVIPPIFAIKDDANIKFKEFANNIKGAWKLVEEKVDEYVNNYVSINNDIEFSKKSFLANDVFLQIEILFAVLKKYNLSKEAIKEIISLINSNKANIKSFIGNSFTFYKEYNNIIIKEGLIEPTNIHLVIDCVNKHYYCDNISVFCQSIECKNVLKSNEICYNINMLPVTLRSRKPGDKIKLTAGEKKVKDLLIDEKIGISKREKILILEDKNQKILAVIGLKKSFYLKEIKDCNIVLKINTGE
ncbi:MAG TPA: tRNA lysidine(34) synthetase TilS [Acholeplasmataceae bacterium]|nr:tRNA lysidine(34) synthetase TilS [Acholeplasmataceae bacterium]